MSDEILEGQMTIFDYPEYLPNDMKTEDTNECLFN